jgi:hypothetical protein
MYLKRNFVNDFFRNLRKNGVKTIIIVGEGHKGNDIVRDDDTIMYSFKDRLALAGYKNKHFMEKTGRNGMYKYFVMY